MESNISGSLCYNKEFPYTWVIENYQSVYHAHGIDIKIGSPLIRLHNRGKRYEFQLKINSCFYTRDQYYLRIWIETLLCPDDHTKARFKCCFLKSNGAEFTATKSTSSISKGKACFSYDINYRSVPDKCLDDGNLTVKLKIIFCDDITRNPDNAVLDAATALSKMSILDKYEELLNSAKFSDVTIVVGEKKFPAHKNILATRSPVFSAMFDHDMLENKKNIVEITDVEPEIMAEILRFIYADKANNLKELAADLLVAADKYQLEDLRLMCEEILVNKLNIDNVAEILKIVDRYESCRRLRDSAMKFLIANGREIASLKNFDKIFEALSPVFVIEVTKATMLEL